MTDQKPSRDYWMKDNSIFVCDGWKYGITKDGSTVCVGPVAKPTETPPEPQKPVAKIPIKEILPIKMSQTQEKGIMQQEKRGRGRPTKEGEVHRTTKWRREKQGVLL